MNARREALAADISCAARSPASLRLSCLGQSAEFEGNEPAGMGSTSERHSLGLHRLAQIILGMLSRDRRAGPQMIAITGSVAVGKSTTARALASLLERRAHLKMAVVGGDGFLFPERVLSIRSLRDRKGHPETFDWPAMLRFLRNVRSNGVGCAPVYSHETYDIVDDCSQRVSSPDILLVEGLHLLRTERSTRACSPNRLWLRRQFDLTVYIDAAMPDIRSWYMQRCLKNAESSRLEMLRSESDTTKRTFFDALWREINQPNFERYIRPTRKYADVVVRKNSDHSIGTIQVCLRA